MIEKENEALRYLIQQAWRPSYSQDFVEPSQMSRENQALQESNVQNIHIWIKSRTLKHLGVENLGRCCNRAQFCASFICHSFVDLNSTVKLNEVYSGAFVNRR